MAAIMGSSAVVRMVTLCRTTPTLARTLTSATGSAIVRTTRTATTAATHELDSDAGYARFRT